MNCITRHELKFGDLIIPPRTKCKIINKPNTFTVDAPGVQLNIVINNFDINKQDIANENKVIKYHSNVNNASLCGVWVHTNTQAVYMDAGDREYCDYGLYDWELEKIFGKGNVPPELLREKHSYYGKDARLQDVIDYLEEDFSDWVEENCEFCILTEDDIEGGLCFEGAEVGDNTLSPKGIEQFNEKCLEYKNRLETTGFTYEFTGGLIWS
ncbi:hypothetical protein [Clostridium neonatale]|uniref:hypothetical protein n=1 Tax=Clostridium neonatale TaxID=137838 RepID=UPI00374ED8CD